jgi:hypothetical protein
VTNNPVNRWDYLGMDVQYVDGNGSSFSDMNIGKTTLAGRVVSQMSSVAPSYGGEKSDDADKVVGTVRIVQSDGSVREIQVTQGMSSSGAPISSLSTMGTVTPAVFTNLDRYRH